MFTLTFLRHVLLSRTVEVIIIKKTKKYEENTV